MHLITMAHLGEAQGVIELFKLKKTSPHTFVGDDLTCLITGEGPFEAATACARQLGESPYESILNLGIAGSLSEQHSVGEIHSIRSLYLAIDGKPQFKSFKSSEHGLDCITSFERILSKSKAEQLCGIGQLVDREAWGVAMAAKNSQTPFSSFKLISDLAGSLGACEIVREKSLEWSFKLAHFLQDHLSQSGPVKSPAALELDGFYFTFTSRHQFEHHLKMISIREDKSMEEILQTLPLDELRSQKLLPKERTRILLTQLEEKLDPLKASLQSGLTKWKSSHHENGITLQTDPTWENPQVKITFSVTSDQELQQKIEHLKSLSLKPFQDLRNGNLHVE